MVSDDLVNRFAEAIAHAEGFYSAGSLPQRCHNPGDLTDDGDVGNGTAQSTGIGATKITIYSCDDHGWFALKKKIRRALNGESKVYPLSMTIEEFGMKYSEDANWGVNVAQKLGAPNTTTLDDLVVADMRSQASSSADG